MVVLKSVPEDFLVFEVFNNQFIDAGPYLYFLLKKRDYTTDKSVELISNVLHKPVSYFGVAGNKDRHAVTEQLVSVKGASVKDLEKVHLNGISVRFLGFRSDRLNLGDLIGNRFIITVRDCDDEIVERVKNQSNKGSIIIPNYFDDQRFSENNHIIGKFIVKGDYLSAVSALLTNKGSQEQSVREFLDNNPSNYVGALRSISNKSLRLYIHAYQSYLWNRSASLFIERRFDCRSVQYSLGSLFFPDDDRFENMQIPIIGFGSGSYHPAIADIIKTVLDEDGVTDRDFIVRAIPGLSSEGGFRSLFFEAKNFVINEATLDELHVGKSKVVVEFFLDKGCYATMVIKALFG